MDSPAESKDTVLSKQDEKNSWALFRDDKGNLSSFRVMAMVGLLFGGTALVLLACGLGHGVDLELALVTLFGVIFGGKAAQKYIENPPPKN